MCICMYVCMYVERERDGVERERVINMMSNIGCDSTAGPAPAQGRKQAIDHRGFNNVNNIQGFRV